MGTHHRQLWMQFQPPLLTAGEQFVKNSSSSRIQLITQLFSETKPQRPRLTIGEEVPCVGLG